MSEFQKLQSKFFDKLASTSLRKSFQFLINIDKVESYISDMESGDFSFHAQSSSIPSTSMENIPTKFLGIEWRIPGSVTFESPWNVTIREAADMSLHSAFTKWRKEVADLKLGGGGDKRIPTTTARVTLLDDKLENALATYVLVGVYPQSIGEISLDYEGNEISTFDAALEYQYFYNEDEGDPLA